MKKTMRKMVGHLLILTLVFSMFTTTSFVSVSAAGIIEVNDTFEDATVDAIPSKWSNSKYGITTVAVKEETGNKYAKLSVDGTATDVVRRTLDRPLSLAGGGADVVIEAKVRAASAANQGIYINFDKDGSLANYYEPTASNSSYAVLKLENGKINGLSGVYNDEIQDAVDFPNFGLTVGNFTANTWTSLKIRISVDNHKIAYYLNGEKVGEGEYVVGHLRNIMNLESIGFSGVMDVDDVKAYYVYDAPVATLLSDNGKVYTNEDVSVSFSTDMDSATLNNNTVKLYKGEAEVSDYEGSYSNKVYTITNWAGFEEGAEYKVVLSDGIYANNLSADYETGKLSADSEREFTFVYDSAAKSHDASLKDIAFDNHSVNGFASTTYNYEVQRSYRFEEDTSNTVRPYDVKCITSNSNATYEVKSPTPGYIIIKVTAEDGYTTQEYKLFVTELGKNLYKNSGLELVQPVAGGVRPWGALSANLAITSDEKFTGNSSLLVNANGWEAGPRQSPLVYMGVTYITSAVAKSESDVMLCIEKSYLNWNDSEVKLDTSKINHYDGTGTYLGSGAQRYSMSEYKNGWKKGFATFAVEKASDDVKKDREIVTTHPSTKTESTTYYADNMYLGQLAVAEVDVAASQNTIVAPNAGETRTINFTADIYNQFGNKVGLTETVSQWKLIGAPAGVSIDSATGTVTVDSAVTADEIIVEAVVPAVTNPFQTTTGGRASVAVISQDSDLLLSDIEVNGNGIYGFSKAKTDYIVDLPYIYEANNFDNFVMPTVTATAMDSDADVEIEYPASVKDGVVKITVSKEGNTQTAVYNLKLRPVGANLYADGGFETGEQGSWSTAYTSNSDDKYAGNKSASVARSNWTLYFHQPVTVTTGKKYIGSWAVKPEGLLVQIDDKTASASASRAAYLMDGTKATDQFAFSELANGWKKNMLIYTATSNTSKLTCYYPSTDQTGAMLVDDAYLSELIVSRANITTPEGFESVNVPESGSTTVQLGTQLFNQFGNGAGLENVTDITWSVKGNPEGMSIDSNGLLTIDSTATSGIITVEASVALGDEFVQDGVVARADIIVLPGQLIRTISHESTDGTVLEGIAKGTVVPRLVYTNETADEVQLWFATALYSKNGNVLSLENVITSDVKVDAYKTFNDKLQSVEVPAATGYVVKSFAWKANQAPAAIAGVLE